MHVALDENNYLSMRQSLTPKPAAFKSKTSMLRDHEWVEHAWQLRNYLAERLRVDGEAALPPTFKNFYEDAKDMENVQKTKQLEDRLQM